MQTIFLIFMFTVGGMWPEEDQGNLEKNRDSLPQIQRCFWPPDLIPHPDIPGGGPSGPGEPELA
jgi:hypothetical protein